MQFLKAKKDIIPLVVTVCVAFYFIIESISNHYVFPIQQMAGMGMLALCSVLFIRSLRIGVLCLGLYFILGWIGIIRISSSNNSYFFATGDINFIFYHAHPLMFYLMIFHLIISGRHYFGIGTAKYWNELIGNKADKKAEVK